MALAPLGYFMAIKPIRASHNAATKRNKPDYDLPDDSIGFYKPDDSDAVVLVLKTGGRIYIFPGAKPQ